MMQSVALYDSVVVPNDDEWIVLDSTNLNSVDDQVLGDDSSYDYCDDAEAELLDASLDSDSELTTLRNQSHPSSRFNDEILGATDKESISDEVLGDPKLQVGLLLQDILETVADRHDGLQLDGRLGNKGFAMTTTTPMIVESDWEANPDALEDSPILNPCASNRDDQSTTSSVVSSEHFLSFGDDKRLCSESSCKMDLLVDTLEQATQRSRLSNKKRRKQLKLHKKAAAAAAAAVAISHIHMAVPSTKQSKAKNKKQVGIALQAIESYKQEVLQSSNKNKKLTR